MLILASQSPRRAELLRQIGVAFDTAPADIDETRLAHESAHAYVERMAIEKARAMYALHPDYPVLGSDTSVVLGERILGKPRDREHGIAMLLGLAGHTHRVLTGVALVHARIDYLLSESRVRFGPISEQAAARYWDSGEPRDKAGGYAIQGLGAVFVEHIEGSYSGVMGLPLFETARLLRGAGIEVV